MRIPPRKVGAKEDGFVLGVVLGATLILSIIIIALGNMFANNANTGRINLDSTQAFYNATSGRELAIKWLHDNPLPTQPTRIYDGAPGPDKGTYTVDVIPDTANAGQYHVLSTGQSGIVRRTIQDKVGNVSFSQYGYFANQEPDTTQDYIWFMEDDYYEGNIYVGGVPRMYGRPGNQSQFHGQFTTSAPHFLAYLSGFVPPDTFEINGTRPYFEVPYVLNTPQIPMPPDVTAMMVAAHSGGFPIPDTTGAGWDVMLGAKDGTTNLGFLCYSGHPASAHALPSRSWHDVAMSSLSKPIVYSNSPLFLQGTLQGQLTVASGDSIILSGPILYATQPSGPPDNNCTDYLGIVAARNIEIDWTRAQDGTYPTRDLTVYGSMIAIGGNLIAKPVLREDRGTLTIYGSLVQNKRENVNFIDGNFNFGAGYHKFIRYDPRLKDGQKSPPFWPKTTVFQSLAGEWKEVQPQ